MRSTVTFVAGLLSAVAVSAASPSRAVPGSRLSNPATIAVHFDDAVNIGEFAIHAAMIEAQELWKPYDIVLVRAAQPDLCINVMITDAPVAGTPRTAWSEPLGSIDFSPPGVPDRDVHVSRLSIEQLLNYPGSPLHSDAYGRTVHDWIVGRILGRVVAHEIGHYVLRFPGHVAEGLMAARHTAAEFTGVYRKPFDLGPSLEGRLHEVLQTRADLCTTY